MNVGEKIRYFRKEKHFSQKKLAQQAGISNTYLCDVEKGRSNCSLETLVKLADALDVKPEELLQ